MPQPEADVRIVGMSGFTRNYPELIAQALTQRGLRCETYSIPFTRYRPSVLQTIKNKLGEASQATVSIYFAAREIYLSGADISVHFSAYRRWFQPERMRVIAHPWTESEPQSIDAIKWTKKPPLTVGFMGTAYSNSRLGQMIGKSSIKRWILSGHPLRFPGVVATLNGFPFRNAMTFPRAETLRLLDNWGSTTGVDVRIVDTGGFTGSREQISQYERHMRELTYVLCPRGFENFSYRFYEALKYGKVPVLVDTEVVLPDGVNWDELILRVPYNQLASIGKLIARDYERHSAAQFKERQEKALAIMAELCAGGWADGLANDVKRQLAQKVRD